MNRQAATRANLPEPDAHLDDLVREVIDAAIEVHRVLGPGYLEGIYEDALRVELRLRGLASEQQVPIHLDYKGEPIGVSRLDMLVAGQLIVELKATDGLLPVHIAQVISYLRASRHRLGLLINFNVRNLRHGIRRIILSDPVDTPLASAHRRCGTADEEG